jgi:hypothetical protein
MLPPEHREAALLDAEGREVASLGRQARCCTDCHWCIIFLVAILGFAGLAGFGLANGNSDVWKRFVTARDSNDRLCGFDDGVRDFKYAYYTLAVGDGPVHNDSYWDAATRQKLQVVCTNACPKANQTRLQQPVALREDTSACPENDAAKCTWYGGETFTVVHYCIDTGVFDVTVPWEQSIEDLRAAAPHLLSVFPVAILMGFLFLTVLEKCGAVCVWVILIAVAVIPAGLGVWVFNEAGHKGGLTGQVSSLVNLTPENQKYVAYVLWGISAAVLLLSCCFAGTIRGIAAVVKLTSLFLKDVPSQMLQPLVFCVAHLIAIVVWLAVFIQVMSIGASEGEQKKCLQVGDIYCMEWNSEATKWGAIFLILVIYWTLNFLHACSHFGTAYAVGAWYFTKEDALTGKKAIHEGGLSCCDIKLTVKAVTHGLRRHAGSFAFGAFAISLAKVIKLLLRWVSKDYESQTANGAVQCCLRCTNCLAECFERFIEFVSEHAYVEMALRGHNFCTSAKEAMALAARKPGLFALTGRVTCVVRLMGIAVVTCVSTYVVALTIMYIKPEGLHSVTAPLFAAALCSLTVGEVMMHPFTAAARANLHCFCLDCACHVEAEFTSQAMQRIVDDHDEHLRETKQSCCGRCCPCF